jgi:hypothetical protein
MQVEHINNKVCHLQLLLREIPPPFLIQSNYVVPLMFSLHVHSKSIRKVVHSAHCETIDQARCIMTECMHAYTTGTPIDPCIFHKTILIHTSGENQCSAECMHQTFQMQKATQAACMQGGIINHCNRRRRDSACMGRSGRAITSRQRRMALGGAAARVMASFSDNA